MQNSTGEESHLAIETSGHGALMENHWLDDGAYLMVDFYLTPPPSQSYLLPGLFTIFLPFSSLQQI